MEAYMDRRFINELQLRFDSIEDRGFCHFTTLELKRWFDRQRIGKGIWLEIQEKWQDRSDVPLLVGDNGDGTFSLFWGGPEYMVPLSKWTDSE
jgi:hypothetical protein